MMEFRATHIKPLYDRESPSRLGEAFEACRREPTMRSVRAVLRLVDEQYGTRESFIRLRERILALVGVAALLLCSIGLATFLYRLMRLGVPILLIGGSLVYTAFRHGRAIKEMEREQDAIDDLAAQTLAETLKNATDLEPLDPQERKTVRRLVRGRPAFQEAALRLLFDPNPDVS
ncbi:MAG: hypothetical protein ACO1SV_01280 [Fimbriimonas sp.]